MNRFFKVIPLFSLLVLVFSMTVFLYDVSGNEKKKNYFVDDDYLEKNYTKTEHRIKMRDGVKLYTIVYSPNDKSEKYPVLLCRTPYGIGPYNNPDDCYNNRRYSWNHYVKEKFIIVYQDVRGRFMSEGEYENMRPYLKNKTNDKDVDETTDTYDTIDWLVKNIPDNNGNVGLWGISYPGFYAAIGAVDAHPALKAVSPQAPIANWFARDDWHHNGALAIGGSFDFLYQFGQIRKGLVTNWPPAFIFPMKSGYKFFLGLGPLRNVNELFYHNRIPFWNDILEHDTYDEFWQARNNLSNLKNIKPAVLVVGGWFDAENLYGALYTYQAIESGSPGGKNNLVMGPWYHGGWVRSSGENLGDISFDQNTRDYYAENIELPFFNYYLKNKGELNLPEANIFITGSNEWKTFSSWPPDGLKEMSYFLCGNRKLTPEFSESKIKFAEYISDPAKPVPFTKEVTTEIPKTYMVEDQSFIAGRKDVLVFQTDVLEQDITIMGKIIADLFVSTSGTDCDFVVKIIDVIPAGEMKNRKSKNDYQMLLRGDIFRAKFRNSLESPEPMIPNEITNLKIELDDVAHTFKKGHRIMVHIQSSWFPLFDLNPNKFMKISDAETTDFSRAKQRVYFSKDAPSRIIFGEY